MNRNPHRQQRNGGGKPYSLINAQRDMTTTVARTPQPLTITRELIMTGARVHISTAQAYGELFDSFRALPGVPQSQALTELLASGATIANHAALYRQEASA